MFQGFWDMAWDPKHRQRGPALSHCKAVCHSQKAELLDPELSTWPLSPASRWMTFSGHSGVVLSLLRAHSLETSVWFEL